MKKNRSFKSAFFAPRILLASLLCSAGATLAMFSFAAPTPTKPLASQAVTPVISHRVRDLPTNNQFTDWSDTLLGDIERPLKGRETSNPNVRDPVVQTAAPNPSMPA